MAEQGRWLVKSDPQDFGFPQLAAAGTVTWDGVRNPTAQLHLRAMADGDRVLVYHTGSDKAIVGTATVIGAPFPDKSAADPRIVAVRLRAGAALPRSVSLAAIKAEPTLATLPLVRMGRLSVMPIPAAAWRRLLAMGGAART